MLTRIGVEPQRELLTKALMKFLPPGFSYDTPGFHEMSSVKKEYMYAFLDVLQKDYGGVEGYCKNKLGLSEEEIEAVKKRLAGGGHGGEMDTSDKA